MKILITIHKSSEQRFLVGLFYSPLIYMIKKLVTKVLLKCCRVVATRGYLKDKLYISARVAFGGAR